MNHVYTPPPMCGERIITQRALKPANLDRDIERERERNGFARAAADAAAHASIHRAFLIHLRLIAGRV